MTDTETAAGRDGLVHARLPQDWTAPAAPEVTVDREEITVVLTPRRARGRRGRHRRRAGRGASPAGSRASARRPASARIGDRPRGRAPVRPEGGVGRAGRRATAARAVHPPGRAGHDPAAPARAAGARHPGRRRGGPLARRTRWPGACGWSAQQRRRSGSATCARRWSRSSEVRDRARRTARDGPPADGGLPTGGQPPRRPPARPDVVRDEGEHGCSAWNTSWKPNQRGHGFGPLQRRRRPAERCRAGRRRRSATSTAAPPPAQKAGR